MSTRTPTVKDRVEYVQTKLTPMQIALAIALVLALGMTLFALQEPAVHSALHDFRHTAGITCH